MLIAAAFLACSGPSTEQSGKPDVYLLLVDTLRADHLSLYGYSRPTSRNLERFAETAIVFEDVIAPASWTLPSVASVITGAYPSVHGLKARRGGTTLTTLRPALPTLAEVLREAGYRTVAIVTNPWMQNEQHGLRRGFEDFRTFDDINAPEVNEIVREVVESSDARPLFLYVHYMDPHGPYDRHAELDPSVLGPLPDGADRLLTGEELERLPKYLRLAGRSRLGAYIEAYDRAIYAWDQAFGEWIDWLDGRPEMDDALVLVISDHGEEFLEHGGWNHGETLYQEQLGVPWVMRIPGREGRRIGDRVVSLIDVGPTILTEVAARVPPTMAGRHALDDTAARSLFAETDLGPHHRGRSKASTIQRSVRSGDRKLIQLEGGKECYDLRSDPTEQNALCEDPEWSRQAEADLERWKRMNLEAVAVLGESAEVELSPADQERLRALGYGE